MAKRKQIVKFLEYAENVTRENCSEGETIELDDFDKGVIFGLNIAKRMIKYKEDKKHGF